jgi:hypothetical protein
MLTKGATLKGIVYFIFNLRQIGAISYCNISDSNISFYDIQYKYYNKKIITTMKLIDNLYHNYYINK